MAQQGHLLVRHNTGLKCKACNVYRADRQFIFWNRTPCVPRPCAADVISQIRNKKRQHNAYTDDSACCKSVFPSAGSCATSAPTRRHETSDVESGQGAASLISNTFWPKLEATVTGIDPPCLFPLSLKVTLHTQQFCVCTSPSQVGEQCDGSRYVSAQMQICDRSGKERNNPFLSSREKEEDASTLARNVNS